ncbi:MAG: porin [Pseudomonadota bacterium]|mgnify:CR=1 FL=1
MTFGNRQVSKFGRPVMNPASAARLQIVRHAAPIWLLRSSRALVVFSALACPIIPAHARDDAERIQALEARVAAQDAVIRELSARIELLARSATPIAPAPSPGAQPVLPSVQPTAISRPSPITEIATADGVTIRPHGRLQVDALLVNSGDGNTPTGTQLRRLQLGAAGRISPEFRYNVEVAYAGRQLGVEDAIIAWAPGSNDEVIVGHFKPPVTLDELTSDNYTLFLERSAYASLLAPGRRVGIGYTHWSKDWGIRASISGERDDVALDGARQEGWVAAARLHGNLLAGSPDVLHLAASTYYIRPSSTDRLFSYSVKPEASRALAALSTGSFTASSGLFLGAEAAWSHGPFQFVAEGGRLRLSDVSGSQNAQLWGWSAQASWRITGERRPYDSKAGSFGRIVPAHPIGKGWSGGWEVGLRMSQADLNDGLLTGGKLTTWGAVVNWIPVTHLRLSGNAILARTERMGLPDNEQLLVALRAGIDW